MPNGRVEQRGTEIPMPLCKFDAVNLACDVLHYPELL